MSSPEFSNRVSSLTGSRGIITHTNPHIKTSGGGLDSESSPQHGFAFCVMALGQEQPKYYRNNQSEFPSQFNNFQKNNNIFIHSFQPQINLKLDPHPVSFLLFSLILCLNSLSGNEQTMTELPRNADIFPVRRIYTDEYRDLASFFFPAFCSEELHYAERKKDTRFQGRNGPVKFAFFIKPS